VLHIATVIQYLDKHSGAFAALLTLALIGVTGYYAVQNRRMVKEMIRTRELSILPKLALDLHRLAAPVVTVAVKNVGPGAALNVDVRLIYDPREATSKAVERRWRHNVLVSGATYDFLPPGDLNANIDGLPATYRQIRLIGSMRDAAGKLHIVDESFADLPEWRAVLEGVHQRFVHDDPERRLAEAFAKNLKDAAKPIATQLEALNHSVGRLVPPGSRAESDVA
jgi:hypothetical protein